MTLASSFTEATPCQTLICLDLETLFSYDIAMAQKNKHNIQFVRRTLIPLLIVALSIATIAQSHLNIGCNNGTVYVLVEDSD
jgi:hypothetical protein